MHMIGNDSVDNKYGLFPVRGDTYDFYEHIVV